MWHRRWLPVLMGLVLLEGNATLCAEPSEGKTVSKEEEAVRSDIHADEEVVFYPTYGHFDEESESWTIPIHGIIYEPEHDSRSRNALLASIRKMMEMDAEDLKSQYLDRRLRLFLVDNERGQKIHIRIGDAVFAVGTSESNGHFYGTLPLAAEDVERLAEKESGVEWLTFEAVTRSSDERRFMGRGAVDWTEGAIGHFGSRRYDQG